MSYDLHFRARSGVAPALDGMRAWFEKRARYRFHGTADSGQAAYENKVTGVYFQFDFESVDQDPEVAPVLPIAFNMNYFRPHVFGLEAEPEVAAFVRHFELSVEDPQGVISGGDYDAAGFLRGWDEGNRAAYRIILAQGARLPNQAPDEPRWTLPAVQIASTWRWNCGKDALAERMDDELMPCFVPTIVLLRSEIAPGRVLRAVVWDGGCGILLPEVDIVFRNDDQDGLGYVAMEDLAAALPPSDEGPVDLGHRARVLPADCLGSAWPARMKSLFRPFAASRLDPSQVLDAELVSAASVGR